MYGIGKTTECVPIGLRRCRAEFSRIFLRLHGRHHASRNFAAAYKVVRTRLRPFSLFPRRRATQTSLQSLEVWLFSSANGPDNPCRVGGSRHNHTVARVAHGVPANNTGGIKRLWPPRVRCKGLRA
jgi:hypothetical protein